MSKEKQIEEMAKDLDACPYIAEPIGCNKHEGSIKIAEYLVSKRYRKQSEGEWIKHEALPLSRQCGNCKGWYTKHSILEYESNYCPNCGAHMKGGAE